MQDSVEKQPSKQQLWHSFLTLPRAPYGVELLDLGAGSLHDVQASLNDLWRINRFTGGINALTRHLYPYLRQESQCVTVVDLATGSGQLAAHIAAWAQQNGCRLRIYGLDIASRHLNIASKNFSESGQLIQADALQLPFPENGIDYLVSSLFAHHLDPPHVVRFLKESFKRVRKAMIISDLERGWLPLIAFKLGQPVFARSYLTRHDGPVSIRRGYTRDELYQMALEVGLTNARVYRALPWRMTLVADKP